MDRKTKELNLVAALEAMNHLQITPGKNNAFLYLNIIATLENVIEGMKVVPKEKKE